MTQWDFTRFVCARVCVDVFVVLVVVVARDGGFMAATSPWRQDIDAGVSTVLAAERNNMERTKKLGRRCCKYRCPSPSFKLQSSHFHIVLPLSC